MMRLLVKNFTYFKVILITIIIMNHINLTNRMYLKKINVVMIMIMINLKHVYKQKYHNKFK